MQGNPTQVGFLFHRVATKQACMKSSHNPRPRKRCSRRKPNGPYISLVHTYTCLARAIHIDPSNTLRPCSLSMWHAPLSTIIPHSIIGASAPPSYVWLSLTSHQEHTYCLLPSIRLSRYLSGHLLSRTHLVTRSPTHVVPSRSPGDLSMTNIHSLLPMSAFSPYVSLDLSPLFVRPLLATC